jgi:hypothetical protein
MTSGSRPGKGLIGRSTSSNSAARISIRQTPRPCTPATACWRHVPVSRAIGPSPRRGSCSPWQRSPPGRRARLCCRSRNDPGTRGAASISANRACRTDNFHCPRSLPPKSPLKENSLFCPATQLSAILGERAGHASSRSVNLTTIKAIREGSMKRTIAAVFIAARSPRFLRPRRIFRAQLQPLRLSLSRSSRGPASTSAPMPGTAGDA